MKNLTIALMLAWLPMAQVRADEPSKKLEKEPAPIAVPFELLKSQHMVVNVKINGKGPYRLIFDTGAPFTLINNKIAKEAEVFPKDFKPPIFALFGSNGQFKIKALEIGDLKVDGTSAMVMDHPTVSAISKALGPIEGIVGFNVFAKHRMSLDYQKKEMTFVPVDYEPKDMMQAVMKMMLASGEKKAEVVGAGGLVGIQVDKADKDQEAGVNVKTVFANSPAAAAGLKVGDRLLTLDSRWTDTVVDCHQAAKGLRPGSQATATLLRDGKEITVKLKLGAGI